MARLRNEGRFPSGDEQYVSMDADFFPWDGSYEASVRIGRDALAFSVRLTERQLEDLITDAILIRAAIRDHREANPHHRIVGSEVIFPRVDGYKALVYGDEVMVDLSPGGWRIVDREGVPRGSAHGYELVIEGEPS